MLSQWATEGKPMPSSKNRIGKAEPASVTLPFASKTENKTMALTALFCCR
jgi:hypothetical protein